MKRILYIGNDLTAKTKYNSTLTTLSQFLRLEGYNVIISSNQQNKVFRLLDMLGTIINFRKKLDFILIDTFSTSNFYYAFLTSQLARLFKIKYVPILHGGNLPYRLDHSKFMSQALFANSYKNIAPSNYLRYEFEKRGYPVEFIPNIIEIKNYKFKLRRSIDPTLLYVRAFAHLYNPTMAIYVLNLIKKEYPKAKLCMIGPIKDDSFEKTKKLVKELNLQNDVEFTGVLTKDDWHKRSEEFDIFINTTNFDNTPVSVMEAMALGLTIISTNVGGMPFLINSGVDGILVEKENPKAMANEIIKLIKECNQALAKNARKKVEYFNWETVKKDWHKILNI